MKSFTTALLFAIIGCVYVSSFESNDSDVRITLICVCLPLVSLVVFTVVHSFVEFMSAGFKEAEARIKEKEYRANFRL